VPLRVAEKKSIQAGPVAAGTLGKRDRSTGNIRGARPEVEGVVLFQGQGTLGRHRWAGGRRLSPRGCNEPNPGAPLSERKQWRWSPFERLAIGGDVGDSFIVPKGRRRQSGIGRRRGWETPRTAGPRRRCSRRASKGVGWRRFGDPPRPVDGRDADAGRFCSPAILSSG